MTESLPAPKHRVQEDYGVWYVAHCEGETPEQYSDYHFFNLECGLTLHVNDTWHDWLKSRSGIEGHIDTRRDIVWELNAQRLDLTREGQKRKVYWPSVEEGKKRVILAARDVLGRNLKELPGGFDMDLLSHCMKAVVEDDGILFESERLTIKRRWFRETRTEEEDRTLPPDEIDVIIRIPPETVSSRMGNLLMTDLCGVEGGQSAAGKEYHTTITDDEFKELCRALWRPQDPSIHKNLPKTPEGF